MIKMKYISLLFMLIGFSVQSWAQSEFPEVTIQEIQTVSDEALAACNDSSSFLGDTIITTGVVVVDAGLAQAASGRNIWIQNGTGPFSGLDLFANDPPALGGTEIEDLVAGDSVKITGIIDRFRNETQIIPLLVEVLDFGKEVVPTVVPVSDINSRSRVNQFETGEQWEGVYVEFQNVTVTSVDFFESAGVQRVSFDVADENGFTINVGDRFIVQRLPGGGGEFVPPTEGTVFEVLRGVIFHGSPNGCTGGTGRGYELYPFRTEDYQLQAGTAPPQIAEITRTPTTPTSTEATNISAFIQDPDGTIDTAILFYAVGVENDSFISVPMTGSGTTFEGVIPAEDYEDGDFVKYYISATDDSSFVANSPNVPNGSAPLFFTVRDSGLSIFDVQFTPFDDGNSGYIDQEVTVEGVVISEALGATYIQQEGIDAWAGIQVIENADLAALLPGDKVRVTGTVRESFGLTLIGNTTLVEIIGTGEIEPLVLDPTLFSTYDVAVNEQYEGMLITLANPNGGGIFVVNANADDPSAFGEYRVGLDVFDGNSGTRVLAGRRTGSAPSSLDFSYINDSIHVFNEGEVNVPVCIVSYQDTMASITGVMHYSFSNLKLLPRTNDDVVDYSGANCPDGVEEVTTSIADELAGSEWIAYPNPTSSIVNVKYNFTKPVNAEITLIDMMGRAVLGQKLHGTNGVVQLSVAPFATGIYQLLIVAENQVIGHEKVVVSN